MSKEVGCSVIRDLLPLYEDGVVSEETAQLVREHLKDCPDCREELRKMRTPISVPPEEDGELWERFEERRVKLRRRKKIRRACIGVTLAALAVFCLCYTLIPRSWSGVGGGTEPDWVSGIYAYVDFNKATAGFDVWAMSREKEGDAAVVGAVMDALKAGSYRAQLRNLANHTPLAPLFQDLPGEKYGGFINLLLVRDGETAALVILCDTNEVRIQKAGDPNTYFYHTDGAAYAAIAALIQEYGELQE